MAANAKKATVKKKPAAKKNAAPKKKNTPKGKSKDKSGTATGGGNHHRKIKNKSAKKTDSDSATFL